MLADAADVLVDVMLNSLLCKMGDGVDVGGCGSPLLCGPGDRDERDG